MSIGFWATLHLDMLTAHQDQSRRLFLLLSPDSKLGKHHLELCIHRFEKTSLVRDWLCRNAYLRSGMASPVADMTDG